MNAVTATTHHSLAPSPSSLIPPSPLSLARLLRSNILEPPCSKSYSSPLLATLPSYPPSPLSLPSPLSPPSPTSDVETITLRQDCVQGEGSSHQVVVEENNVCVVSFDSHSSVSSPLHTHTRTDAHTLHAHAHAHTHTKTHTHTHTYTHTHTTHTHTHTHTELTEKEVLRLLQTYSISSSQCCGC